MRSVQVTKQQLVTVCRRYGAYTLLAAGMVALSACGGGGGSISDPVNTGDNITPTVTPTPTTVTPTPTPAVVTNTDTTPLNPRYTGKRELAVLTEAVAIDFLKFGQSGWARHSVDLPVTVSMATPLLPPELPYGTVGCKLDGKISRTFENSLSDDRLSKTYVTQYTYDKCHGKIVTIDGSTSSTRTETYGSPITFTETVNHNLTVIANGNITEISDGYTSLNITGAELSSNQNIYIKEENREILRANLQKLGTIGKTQGSITEMRGRIYLGDYGYVTPKVLQPLSFSVITISGFEFIENQVFAGELVLMGANNTKAQMLPTSAETFVLNTDEDGDGGYEKTRIVNWADL